MPPDAGAAFNKARKAFLSIDVEACRRYWFDVPAAPAAADPNTAPDDEDPDPEVVDDGPGTGAREIFTRDGGAAGTAGSV